ncbi:polyprenol phosphomannose-dependent alpha 1,6 mannosyltransferase MptB [Corynebacterium resistens]|uniref:polyprenol phosphomannose-dependent alpha 1,6 mannosyltransferase MptB n=1 Tax=Corynebacterium resistens TaxID=258224 RepID=UPI002353065F|nr:polyprenol phosphomannose-dependent alpha 1,6 mannosyltransferase MptB [Corynebacterium resistens]
MNRADLHPTPSEDGQPRGVAKIKKWRPRLPIALRETLPRLGEAGSRSALLHEQPSQGTGFPSDSDARLNSVPAQSVKKLMPHHVLRLRVATWLGCFGTVMVALGGLGAGAFPVVGNPYWDFPLASFLSRLLHTSTVTVFLGIGMLVVAWLLLTSFTLPPAPTSRRRHIYLVPERTLWRIFACWVAPILFTAPIFTQDIYSYLAQGSIAAQGLDPYSAGPVDLLGIQDPLARSVPLLWAHSPAPYGPIALGYSALVSMVTGNSILGGIIAHRIISLLGIVLAGWALVRLARRCDILGQSALWLGVLNPLVILHLIAGIHNESVMMGLLLAGMELVLRGVDNEPRPKTSRWILFTLGLALITGAGLVKVTALMGLGFAGVAIARWFGGSWGDLVKAAALCVAVAALVATAVSMGTGVGFGWASAQGGAAEIVSWMSISSVLGLTSGFLGMLLGLGDHQQTALAAARTLGLLVGVAWVIRMLFAAFRGRIHPVGGLGVATFFLVVFFPVVHPWYLLWAILPLAAWANRALFHVIAVGYSVAFSFFILPRGLSLPPATVLYIYAMSAVLFAVLMGLAWNIIQARPNLRIALNSRKWNSKGEDENAPRMS